MNDGKEDFDAGTHRELRQFPQLLDEDYNDYDDVDYDNGTV